MAEAKNFKNPPAGVKLVMETVCILMQQRPVFVLGEAGTRVADYWEPAKKLLGDSSLLSRLLSFDKDNIPDAVIKKLQPYIENEDFTPKKIESASKACTAMCQWVHAMNKYHFVAKEVEPKRLALKNAEEELGELTANLNKLRAQLKEVEDKIASLEAKFNAAVAQPRRLHYC